MVAARVVSDAVFGEDLKGDEYPKGMELINFGCFQLIFSYYQFNILLVESFERGDC